MAKLAKYVNLIYALVTKPYKVSTLGLQCIKYKKHLHLFIPKTVSVHFINTIFYPSVYEQFQFRNNED